MCLIIFINPFFVLAANEPPKIGNTWGEAESASGYDSVDKQIKSTNNLGGGGLGYYIKLINCNLNNSKVGVGVYYGCKNVEFINSNIINNETAVLVKSTGALTIALPTSR